MNLKINPTCNSEKNDLSYSWENANPLFQSFHVNNDNPIQMDLTGTRPSQMIPVPLSNTRLPCANLKYQTFYPKSSIESEAAAASSTTVIKFDNQVVDEII